MIERIVFLYSSEKNRYDITLLEKVVRALIRKYRCTPLFSYLQIDTALSCRERMCELIREESSRRGAIFLESDTKSTPLCMEILKSVFDIYASSHHISGRTICYPDPTENIASDDASIVCTTIYSKERIKKTALLSLEMAKKSRNSLSISLIPENEMDSAFLHEAEIALGKEKHICPDFIPLDEMISLCMKTVPPFDVVLTVKSYARLIAMHLNAMPDIPSGYTVSYGERRKVYKRQILPCEEIGNLHYLSSLLSIAAIFENEFSMKSAASWLRRALSISFEKESGSTPEAFIESIIKEIEKPIRKRRTKKDEN